VPRRRFTTLLVDLDGSLLEVEMRGFLEAFFPLAAARFGGPGEAPRISEAMNKAALAMSEARDGTRTVDYIFLESFAPAVGCTVEEVREMFSSFYRGEFESLRRLVRPVPGARAFVERALSLGCQLVLATNPVFFLDAIHARMRWAGLSAVPSFFALVTGAELMYWTKPHAGYYRQILEMTGRRPEECLMVGDDPRMDMAAKKAGIATWLAVHAPDAPRSAPLADRGGTLQQLATWLEKTARGR
jgi:FMN phosphatase YigB (HAD superfamily)